MFTPAQLEALQAAIDVAFDGTPSDDKERLEMEEQAKAAFAKCREIADLPSPSSKRCRLVTSATKSANVLASAKLVMRSDPQHKVVFMPEIDYVRLWAQVNRLEAQYKVMRSKLQAAQDEIDDLSHVEAVYASTEPEVEAMAPVPLQSGADFDRPLGASPAFEAPYGVQDGDTDPRDILQGDEPLAGPKFRVGEAFHRHLDNCERCRTQPMNLCPVGAILLRKEATNA